MTLPLHTSSSRLRRTAPLALTAGLLLCGAASSLRAQTIISDGFSGTNGATLNGRTPDTTDLPGTTYTTSSQNTGPYQQPSISTAATNATGGTSADSGFNGSASLSIASTGTFTKPTTLTLSASIEINNIQDDNSAALARGIGLGFFTAVPANNSADNGNTNFYGLNVAPSGALYLEENGVRGTEIAAAPAGFSTADFYTLSYTVNTVTGGISNISFDGQNDGSIAADFTDAITNRVGFYGSTAKNAAFNGFVDNFEVSGVVPEPSTWATMIGGLALLGGAQRLRRARRA